MSKSMEPIQINKNITFSGYAKNEVYQDIQVSFKKNDHERLCYLTAELACTKNELNHLIQCIIDEFVQFRISSNILDMKYILESINLLQGYPKKNLCMNNSFQRALCEFVLFTAISPKKELNLLYETVDYNTHIEPIMEKFQHTIAMDTFIEKTFKSKMSNDLLNLMNLLYYLLKNRMLKYCLILTSYLVLSKEHFVDEIDYFELGEVKKQNKKNIVWYIWKLLLIMTDPDIDSGFDPNNENAGETNQSSNSTSESIHQYCIQALKLYSRYYNKRYRLSRINLLFYTMIIICKDCVKEKDSKRKVVKSASDNIYIVYQDILGIDPDQDTSNTQSNKVL